MASPLIDTHCHLDAEGFHQEIDVVIQRAVESGVERLISIGTTLETSQAAVLLSNRYSCVSAVVGIHPNYTHEAKPTDWEKIEDLATHPSVVGVGETGLDRYWDFAPIDIQRDYFERHIDLSRRIHKPFIVHCREAEAETLEVLLRAGASDSLHGVMHSFCGSIETGAVCVRLGMMISFAGMLTYKKNEELRATAKTILWIACSSKLTLHIWLPTQIAASATNRPGFDSPTTASLPSTGYRPTKWQTSRQQTPNGSFDCDAARFGERQSWRRRRCRSRHGCKGRVASHKNLLKLE